jgi:hypothetical protein
MSRLIAVIVASAVCRRCLLATMGSPLRAVTALSESEPEAEAVAEPAAKKPKVKAAPKSKAAAKAKGPVALIAAPPVTVVAEAVAVPKAAPKAAPKAKAPPRAEVVPASVEAEPPVAPAPAPDEAPTAEPPAAEQMKVKAAPKSKAATTVPPTAAEAVAEAAPKVAPKARAARKVEAPVLDESSLHGGVASGQQVDRAKEYMIMRYRASGVVAIRIKNGAQVMQVTGCGSLEKHEEIVLQVMAELAAGKSESDAKLLLTTLKNEAKASMGR